MKASASQATVTPSTSTKIAARYFPTTPPRPTSVHTPGASPASISTPGLTRSGSVGTIPICFDPSSPRILQNESSSFPTGPGLNDSPSLNRSPIALGYCEEEQTSSRGPAEDESPSAALRRRWRDRHVRPNESSEDPPETEERRSLFDDRRFKFDLATAPRSSFGPARLSAVRPTSTFATTTDLQVLQNNLLKPPLLDAPSSDNDDALSCFSLSAYLRPETPSDSSSGHNAEGCPSREATPVSHQLSRFSKPLVSRTADHFRAPAMSSSRSTSSIPHDMGLFSSNDTTDTDATSVSQSSVWSPTKINFSVPEKPAAFAQPSPPSGTIPPTIASSSEFVRHRRKVNWEVTQMASTATGVGGLELDERNSVSSAGSGHARQRPTSNALGGGKSRARSSSSASESAPGSFYSRSQPRSVASSTSLPDSVSSLQDTVLTLHIDQEGFRSIRPTFGFHRYTPRITTIYQKPLMRYSHIRSASSSGVVTTHESGIASGISEFKMLNRESYAFHHAPFDSLPTLRRVTINGDDSKDYISRQASLSLKGNGVYTVQGHEDKGRLFWKFEYLVDYRRSPTGHEVHGEKTFTPLSFYCSPLLLSEDRAKKVRLFHVVRKSVTPKLSASKLQPPSVVNSPLSIPSSAPSVSNLESIPPLPVGLPQSESIDRISGPSSRCLDATSQRHAPRPLTPKRPTTPKRPILPKRPSTARETTERPVENDITPWEAFDSPTKGRPRATSYSTQARPSTATRTEWSTIAPASAVNQSMRSQNPESGPVVVTPLSLRETSARLSIRPQIVPPSNPQGTALPGKIVTAAQIQSWMAQLPVATSSPLAPPRRRGARVLRPSTADTEGRRWPMI